MEPPSDRSKDKAQDVLKGLSVDVEQVSTSVNGINGHANGGADAKAAWRMDCEGSFWVIGGVFLC